MAKKIYWNTVKKWALGLGIPVGATSFAVLIYYLVFLEAIIITGNSGDIVCAGTIKDPCYAIINFTAKEDIFIYPIGYDPYGRETPFETDKALKSWNIYRSWGTGWREIKLNETCTSTWCGAPSNSLNNKYSFAFRKNKNYTIKILAYKNNPKETIKWSFGNLDPFWYGITDINVSAGNISQIYMELGSRVNITANISGVSIVCVDIDHPSYGVNYSCGSPNANFLFNITYFRNNQFNDSSITKNISWDGGGNQTFYIKQHQYDEIINASINVSGFISGAIGWCYQEFANVSVPACNGLSTGSYRNVSSFDAESNIYDGDWETNAMYDGTENATIFINYSKPSFVLSSKWQVKDGEPSETVNLTVNANCFSQSNLQLRAISSYDDDYVYWDCYNGSNWVNLRKGGHGDDPYIWEEAMIWNSSNIGGSYPTNVKIYINNTLSNNLGLVYTGNILLDNFNDTTTIKNISFDYKQTKYPYIKIPKLASVLYFYLDLIGFPYSHCYQETANVSTSCGGLSTGNYNIQPGAGSGHGNLYGCGQFSSTNVTFIYVNYTFPYKTVNATWSFILGTQKSNYNYTIPKPCMDRNNLSLRVNLGHWASSTAFVTGSCLNSTNSWQIVTSCHTAGGGGYDLSDILKAIDGNIDTGVLWVPTLGGFIEGTGWSSPPGLYTINLNEEAIDWVIENDTYPTNASLDVGIIDGVYEWNHTYFNTSQTTSNFNSSVNSYLLICTKDPNGYCNIPLYFTSTNGKIQIKNINISYSYNPNPIYLSLSLIKSFLNKSIDFANIPIKFESSANGTLQISDIKLDYAGGNKTYQLKVHNTTYTQNETLNITLWYSRWEFNFPKYINYIEFIPSNPTSKNVTPYGQTSNSPIFNITTYNYGGKNMNLSIYLNETHSCVNLTWNTNSTRPPNSWPYLLNNTWRDFTTNEPYFRNFCYQETANISTDCGGLSTGNYALSDYYFYINYTKPDNINSAIWQVKYNDYEIYNITTNNSNFTSCYNAFSTKLVLRIFSRNGVPSGSSESYPQCYNNSNWLTVGNYSYQGSSYPLGNPCSNQLYDGNWSNYCNYQGVWKDNGGFGAIYEEAMVWDLNIYNPKIWLWADYNCNFTSWKLWQPDIYIRGCCLDCVCSETLT